MDNREVINWLTRIRDRLMPISSQQFEALTLAISALEKQDADKWIPASEALPEDYTDVLVWFEYFRYGSYNCMYQTYGIGDYSAKYESWTINHETGWKKLRVIAWRPMPEVYQEDKA